MDLRGNFKVYGKFCSCKISQNVLYLRMKLLFLLFFGKFLHPLKRANPTTTAVIEVTEFDFEVSFELRGHLEAPVASEAKMPVRGNMHITFN